uniref:Cation efflux protein n=1 Tax=Seriatopora hystrix TaxID=51070 RepID=D9IV63_9CNID|nr:cation efflux protein [Seriatopora hystrix]
MESSGDSPSSQRSLTMEAFTNEDEDDKQHLLDKHCVSYLEETKAPTRTFLPQKFREKWSRAAFMVSIASLLVTVAFSLLSFVASKSTESSSIFASALDGIMGAFNSLAVAWRFRDACNGKLAPKREKIAAFGIAVTFMLSGSATTAIAILHLMAKDYPEKPDELIIILASSVSCYFFLALVQDCIAKKLDSISLKASAIDSWLAAGMSLGVLGSTFIYRQVGNSVWMLDHSVAVFIGFISVIYGIHLIFQIVFCT